MGKLFPVILFIFINALLLQFIDNVAMKKNRSENSPNDVLGGWWLESPRLSWLMLVHYPHSGLPAMILCKKIGAGKVHILGGLLCCIGMTCTAYCKNAWQALLANGIVTGMFCTDAYLSNVVWSYYLKDWKSWKLQPCIIVSKSCNGCLACPEPSVGDYCMISWRLLK